MSAQMGGAILAELIRNDIVEEVSNNEVRSKPNLDQKENIVRDITKDKFVQIWSILQRSLYGFLEKLAALSFVDSNTIKIENINYPQDTCTYHRSQHYFFPSVITDEMKFIPFIKLDKSVYSFGEDVRFWIGGISSDNHFKGNYPKDDCFPQHTEITNPLGEIKIEDRGVHPDLGPGCGGFLGGWGLSSQDIMVGKYSIVFDAKGIKTQPAIITIQESNLFQGLRMFILRLKVLIGESVASAGNYLRKPQEKKLRKDP